MHETLTYFPVGNVRRRPMEKALAIMAQNLDLIVILGILILAWLWERRCI
jgi:hypothetical protein